MMRAKGVCVPRIRWWFVPTTDFRWQCEAADSSWQSMQQRAVAALRQ